MNYGMNTCLVMVETSQQKISHCTKEPEEEGNQAEVLQSVKDMEATGVHAEYRNDS